MFKQGLEDIIEQFTGWRQALTIKADYGNIFLDWTHDTQVRTDCNTKQQASSILKACQNTKTPQIFFTDFGCRHLFVAFSTRRCWYIFQELYSPFKYCLSHHCYLWSIYVTSWNYRTGAMNLSSWSLTRVTDVSTQTWLSSLLPSTPTTTTGRHHDINWIAQDQHFLCDGSFKLRRLFNHSIALLCRFRPIVI